MTAAYRDFLKASAVSLLFIAWALHEPLLKGQAPAFGAVLPAAQGIGDMSEQLTQLQPGLFTQAKLVKQGVFPAWNPLPHGGTPMLGKMMPGAFSPMHLPFFLLPLSWFPYLLMLVVALKAQLAFSFMYLYCRGVGLRWAGAVFAGILMVFAPRMFSELLYPTWGSALYLPLQLLLVELFVGGKRRAALWLSPWAAALPLLAGHFESAVRVGAVAALYLSIRLRQESARGRAVPWKDCAKLALLALAGLLIAGGQTFAGYEYVGQSYNNAWRTLAEYGWSYHTCAKQLSFEDFIPLVGGSMLAAAFAFLIKRQLCAPRLSLGALAGATACLTLALALLGRLGMTDLLKVARFGALGGSTAEWFCGLLLAFWAAGEFARERPDPIRALGYIMIGSALVVCKTPPAANLLSSLPIVGLFNNTTYFYEYHLALIVICAASLDRALNAPPSSAADGRLALRRAAALCAVLGLAYAAAHPVKNLAARRLSTGVAPPLLSDGGVMGPEKILAFDGEHVIAGWVRGAAAAVRVGRIEGGRLVDSAPAALRRAAGRVYFDASLALGEGAHRIAALVQSASGAQRFLMGPEVQRERRPPWPLFAAALAAALLLPLLPSAVLRLLWAPMLVAFFWRLPLPAVPASQIPYRLPGMDALARDASLFRISSLSQDNFLRADYANLYGVADIRNGGDNLDVLSMIYFIFFINPMLAEGSDAPSRALGLKLLGLANVKYLIDRPHRPRVQPGLEKIHDGDDMTIYRNAHARERAFFLEDYLEVPAPRLADWRKRSEVFRALGTAVSMKGFDPGRTLVLHDSPQLSRPPGRGDASQAKVTMERYEPQLVQVVVDAPRPGFLVLADNVFPGWRARLNGAPVKTLRSWLTLRAVQVPAGRSSVEFSYEPRLLWAALALGALLALAWSVLYLLREPAREAAPPTPLETHGALGEALVAALVAPGVLFWAAWAAFLHRGFLAVNALGAAALLALAGAALARLRR